MAHNVARKLISSKVGSILLDDQSLSVLLLQNIRRFFYCHLKLSKIIAADLISTKHGSLPASVLPIPTAKNLVSWAGCCPRNDQSNRKIKSTRISRAGSYFKPVLIQVANALIKSKKHPEFTARYRRIKARCGHKKAIIAICRMILTAIWHILTDLKPYTPEGFLESRPVSESKILTTSQALNLLKQRGYVIKDDEVSAV